MANDDGQCPAIAPHTLVTVLILHVRTQETHTNTNTHTCTFPHTIIPRHTHTQAHTHTHTHTHTYVSRMQLPGQANTLTQSGVRRGAQSIGNT